MIRQPEGGLLRSAQWAQVLRAEGNDVVEMLCGGVQIFALLHRVPHIGRYLYVPRIATQAMHCTDELVAVAKEHRCAWVRMDITTTEQRQQLKKYKITKAPHDMQPAEHFIIDVTKDEEALLVAMKSKTRYNIRLAKKKGVVVHYITKSDVDFEQMLNIFFAMVEETARRKGVRFHAKRHYRAMFDNLDEKSIALYMAEVAGTFIAGNIVTFYQDTATYLHGATADTHRNLMAPFLLQWEAIRGAKSRGCRYYDFGGVYSKIHDRGKEGITRFKKSFAPKEAVTTYQGSYDIILNTPMYYLYRALQKCTSVFSRIKHRTQKRSAS